MIYADRFFSLVVDFSLALPHAAAQAFFPQFFSPVDVVVIVVVVAIYCVDHGYMRCHIMHHSHFYM